jgi:hypothetical protein
VQHERLSDAFSAATTIIDTSCVSEEVVVTRVLELVRNYGFDEVNSTGTVHLGTEPGFPPPHPGS